MKKAIIVAVIAFIALAACSASAQIIITTKGIDQIVAGSSKQQIEKIIGKKLVLQEEETEDMHFLNYKINYKGAELDLTFIGDTFTELATTSNKVQTREGARVGSTLSDLKKYYGSKLKLDEYEGTVTATVGGPPIENGLPSFIEFHLNKDNVVYRIVSGARS